MARVVLDNLGKIFPGPRGETIHAVRNCSLVVEDGEFIVLVGPSGCGKSTTLRMIAGLEDISSGTVSIDDRVVNAVAPKDRDIAMVFQNYALYPHMTVFDNMAFGLKLRKFPKPEIHRRVQEAATLLGLSDLLDRRPRALSGGQRQRVAVGRAIVRKPSVFLFDEPLSNLDARMRVQTRAELTRLHQRLASTMIYVTHDQSEAMTMGDRIVVMKDGQIQQIATPTDLYQSPANVFVAGFIGSPPMNLIPGDLVPYHDTLVFQERPAESGASQPGFRFSLHPSHVEPLNARAGRPIVLGLRPEHVTEPSLIPDADSRQVIETTVELVEMMGAESFLHLNTGQHSLVARIPAGDRPSINQYFIVAFNTRHARFFDPDTEDAIV